MQRKHDEDMEKQKEEVRRHEEEVARHKEELAKHKEVRVVKVYASKSQARKYKSTKKHVLCAQCNLTASISRMMQAGAVGSD